MLFRSVRVREWRNLNDERLTLGGRVTVLYGRNGQGKSNFVEGMYYSVAFRSFRTNTAADVVRWGSAGASVEAEITLRGLERAVKVEVEGGRRKATLDGKTVKRDSDSLSGAAAVVFGPEDLRMVKAPAAERRRAVDRAVFAVHRTYFREALAFERALKARNVVLRQGDVGEELLRSYDEALAQAGARIVVRRRQLVRAIGRRFRERFREIHGEQEAAVCYRSHEEVEKAEGQDDIVEALLRGMYERRRADLRRGFTGFGPHTDDLEMMLGGRLAREHGSQGQLRSMVLAFKLAELAEVEEGNRETPVLLLDDVASELDDERRRRLFETISAMACQTVLTVTEKELLPALSGRVDWRVEGGHLEPA